MCAKSLIRARQGAITSVSPHNGNKRYIIPNRRGTTPISVEVTAGTGTTDNGDGTYTMTGPDARLTMTGGDPAPAGRFRFRWDIIAQGGTVGGYCSDPVTADHVFVSGGLVTPVTMQAIPANGFRGHVEGGYDTLIYHCNLSIDLCSNLLADDFQTIGNIRIDRYTG